MTVNRRTAWIAALVISAVASATYMPVTTAAPLPPQSTATVIVIVHCVYYSATPSSPFRTEVKGVDVSGKDDGPVGPGVPCSDMAARLAMLGFDILNSTSLTADYNNDGAVDAADYVVWRKNLGTAPTVEELSGR